MIQPPEGQALCPDCRGKKETYNHSRGTAGGSSVFSCWQWGPCQFCDGLGFISLARLATFYEDRAAAIKRHLGEGSA